MGRGLVPGMTALITRRQVAAPSTGDRVRLRRDFFVTSEEEQSVQLTHDARPRPAERPRFPVPTRPKPSVRRSQERRVVRNHERHVTAWLRSLSMR